MRKYFRGDDKHKEVKNESLPVYCFIYSDITLDFTTKRFWRKRLRPLNRQRLNTTGRVVRNVGRNCLCGISLTAANQV